MRKFNLSSSQVGVLLLSAVILTVVFFSYYPTLKNGFLLWDDDAHLYENISVQTLDLEHIKDIFKSTVNHIYIPLTSLSFAVEHHFFGLDPFIYHLDNLLLHLGVVAMVYWFALNLGLSVLGGAFVALLFGLHPVHVESVAWITERKDVLYAFFYMAALLSYCRYLAFTRSIPSFQIRKSYRFLFLTVVFGVLSMLAKPMALSLPLILLLMDWFYGRRIDRAALLEKLPPVAVIAGITWISYVAHARLPGEGVVEGILIWSWTLVFYLRQFILPAFSVPVYHLSKPIAVLNPEFGLSLLAVGVLIFALIRLRKRRWFIFSMAFFFFSIFFLLRYDNVGDTNVVADRFMYLPSLGLCFLAGRGWECLVDKKRLRFLGIAAVVIVTLFFSLRTYTQSQIWRDSISLWRYQLSIFPDDSIALNNLAIALQKQDRYKMALEDFKKIRVMQAQSPNVDFSQWAYKAIDDVKELIGLYKRAIKAEPYSVNPHYNLGKLYADAGMANDAIKYYKGALKIDHCYKDAYFNLGDLYRQAGYASEAIFAYEQAVKLNPEEDVFVNAVSVYNEALKREPKNVIYLEARQRMMDGLTLLINGRPPRATSFFNLGFLYGQMGDYVRAISAYQMALDINSNHSKSLYSLGNIYRDQGILGKALEAYQKVVAVAPRNSDAFVNIGSVYIRLGDQARAKESFEKAVEVNPQNPRAYFDLAYIEENAGNLRNAIDFYQKAIQFDPENAESYYNLGNVLARLGRNPQALSAYSKAIKVNPDYIDALVNLSLLSFREKKYRYAIKYCDEAIIRGYIPPQAYRKALEPFRKGLNN